MNASNFSLQTLESRTLFSAGDFTSAVVPQPTPVSGIVAPPAQLPGPTKAPPTQINLPENPTPTT
jgi:hypothetical protein